MEQWEKETLRSLGKKVAEIAALPEQQEIRRSRRIWLHK